MGSLPKLGKPCSARAGSEWKFPEVPEPVVKVRSVFMNGSVEKWMVAACCAWSERRLWMETDLSKSITGRVHLDFGG